MSQKVHPDAVTDGKGFNSHSAFHVQRRILLGLLLVTVIAPIALLFILGRSQWTYQWNTATSSIERATTIAKEQAEKVFELDASLNARITDFLSAQRGVFNRDDHKYSHEKLARMIADAPQIVSISVYDEAGTLVAHSRYNPVPRRTIANQAYFSALKTGGSETISSVVFGRKIGKPVFSDGVSWVSPEGIFSGAIFVSLDPSYFSAFYEEILRDHPGQSLSLVLKGGSVLARFPSLPSYESKVPQSSAFFDKMKHGEDHGTMQAISPFDRNAKIMSFRRTKGHDLYVVSSIPVELIQNQWLQYMALATALLLIPSALLFAIILFALRRIKDQERALQYWRDELKLRHEIEFDLRESQKFEALGKLLGRVAHDFNNLLMVISTSVQIIRLRRVPSIEKQIDAIERALKNGEAMTRQLLGVSRRQPMKLEYVNLQVQLPEWQTLLSSSIGGRMCHFEIDPDTWPVLVDTVELQLALINLLINARDATGENDSILLSTSNRTTHEDNDEPFPGEFVCICITDKGTGMSREVKDQAFDPLFTTKEPGKGTGLGLSQVANLARAAGGYVTIESELGYGTEVFICLPAAKGAVIKTRTTQKLDAIQNILLVEDNKDIAEGMVTLLSEAGHAVAHVFDAGAAISFLSEKSVDVVISDIHMPSGITGIALAKKLNIDFPSLSVILISGYAEDLQEAISAGLKVIAKPFTLNDLHAQLQPIPTSIKLNCPC